MEAILKFNLPEENPEFNLAVNGPKWSYAMWELDQYLRSKIKYGDDNMTQEQHDTYQEVRDKLWQLLNENNISFDE